MKKPRFSNLIPVPESTTSWAWLRTMNKGQSTFVSNIKRTTLSGILHYYKPLRFTTRKVTEKGVEGFRIWRTK